MTIDYTAPAARARTVRELIEQLGELDPNLPLWGSNPYGAGDQQRAVVVVPDVVAVDPTGKRNPRRETELKYQSNAEKWSDRIAVAYMS